MKIFSLTLFLCVFFMPWQTQAADAQGLTEKALKNAELNDKTLECKGKLKLKNGKAHCGFENYQVHEIVLGDLNGDQINDAAVNIVTHPDGGSGRDGYLAVFLNIDGKPKQAAGVFYGKDHLPADIKTMAIQDGKIILNILGTGENGGNCCPSLKLKEVYQLQGKALALVPEHK